MTDFIAEFCQNHNGDFETLKKMVFAAAEAGATHGKIQSITVDTLSFRPEFEEGLAIDGDVFAIKRPYESEYNRLKNLEVSEAETIKFIALCKEVGIVPMTTCFARSQAELLSDYGFEEIKVASYDCASYPLLRTLKSLFKKVVISTGATFDDEILYASQVMSGANFAFLHCVTMYPTPLEQLHLSRMNWLRDHSPVVGYSDHSHVKTTGLLASKAALFYGAEIVERHFTILEESQTKDGPVSINPEQLQELVRFDALSKQEQENVLAAEMPNWQVMFGERLRELTDDELLNRAYYRGRFASPRAETKGGRRMIFNWEETPT